MSDRVHRNLICPGVCREQADPHGERRRAQSPEVRAGPGADRPAVIASLTELRDMYTKAKTAYDGVGPSPIPRGDELVAGHRKGLTELVPKLEEYLDHALKFPAPSIDSPMLLAGLDVMTWKPEGPGLGELRDTEPVLAEAYQQAPNCQG